MVDILLSTYNGAVYLSQLIDSILQQSYTDWHLTIRDDGSRDETMSIIQTYTNQYPDRISLDTSVVGNIGSLRSFEHLIRTSSAQYIMLADQDDVWLEDKIQHTLSAMQQAEGVDGEEMPLMVYTDLVPVDAELRPLEESFWSYVRLRPELLDTEKDMLAVCNCVSGCTSLMNKAAKDIVLPFGQHAQVHDAVMALQVLQHGGKLIRSDHRDILYRLHGGNAIGGRKVEGGISYIWYKICTCTDVFRRCKRDYCQAKEITGICLGRYITNRIKYLWKR